MADRSNGRSPISQIPSDQLYSILLLLPPKSVVSFAMTCKKFRAVASSDSLWESVCLKQWGPNPVGWFKSSVDYRLVPWITLFKMVSRSDSVTCQKLSCDDCFPDPRASHSLNFVSDSLVLFGGGCEGGRHLDDTWVAYVGGDESQRGAVTWQKVNSGIPSGRFGHSCVVIADSLILFGGIDDHGHRLNDTWVGQITRRGPTTTISWSLVDASSPPPPRGAHGACCVEQEDDHNNNDNININNNAMTMTMMIVHGGIGINGVRFNDTWVLELSGDFRRGSWREVGSGPPSPPARSGHTLTCLGGSRTVLFGGRGVGYEVLDDIWVLESYGDRFKWVRIPYDFRNVPGGNSLPRVGHSASRMLDSRVLIYGGEDSSRLRKSDFWVLDLSEKANLAKIWRGLKVKAYKPVSRSFHRACVDRSGLRVYVFGGMVDGLVQPAEPFGLRFDGELFLVDLLLQM